jgi:hypothetical protein
MFSTTGKWFQTTKLMAQQMLYDFGNKNLNSRFMPPREKEKK